MRVSKNKMGVLFIALFLMLAGINIQDACAEAKCRIHWVEKTKDGDSFEIGTAPTNAKKIAEVRTKAEKGDPFAQNNLGVFLIREGKKKEAEKWIEKSAKQGYIVAQYNLGCFLHKEGRIKEAKKWLKKAANEGNE